MTGVYYSQNKDTRWKNARYTKRASSTATIGSSGCGPTSAAMVLSSLLGRDILPPEVATFSLDNGYRVEGVGTAYSLFPALANEYGLVCTQTTDAQKAAELLAGGQMAVMGCKGGTTGLFSNSGHIVALMGFDAEAGKFLVHDPYLYSNKYTRFGRDKIVQYTAPSGSTGLLTTNDCVRGFDIAVPLDAVAANMKSGFYCYEVEAKPAARKSFQMEVKASVLNVRAGPGTKYAIVGKRKYGVYVTVLEAVDGWAHIEGGGWCSMEYLRRTSGAAR